MLWIIESFCINNFIPVDFFFHQNDALDRMNSLNKLVDVDHNPNGHSRVIGVQILNEISPNSKSVFIGQVLQGYYIPTYVFSSARNALGWCQEDPENCNYICLKKYEI